MNAKVKKAKKAKPAKQDSEETVVFVTEFKGRRIWNVWEPKVLKAYKAGEPNKFPVVSFGMRKALAVVKHLDELREYIEENGE